MTRQELPPAKTPSGMSRVTTLPAPMTLREPIMTPGQMMAPADSHVRPDHDGLAEFSRAANLRVERVPGRVDLDSRAEQRVVPELDFTDIQDHAVEVECWFRSRRRTGVGATHLHHQPQTAQRVCADVLPPELCGWR